MNELIPIKDRDNALVQADLDAEMSDWYMANMPPNTSRTYKNVDDKHRAETTNVL